MLLYVNREEYAEIFASIYNSANTLFEESGRGNVTPDAFIPQIKEDENFLELSDSGEGFAFFSYRRQGKYFELSSLYVRKEHQKEGIGCKLLRFFEEQVPEGGILFVKALKNAPWATRFYHKNGYEPVNQKMREIAEGLGIFEKPWSVIFYKEKA